MTCINFKSLFYAILPFLLLTASCSKKTPDFWTPNGITIANITWNVASTDTMMLLQSHGHWVLPIVPENAAIETTATHHMSPSKEHLPPYFKKADQLVLHDQGGIDAEYYLFSQSGLFLLGYTTHDSTTPVTRYDPPLLLLPNVCSLDTTLTSESMTFLWDAKAETFRSDGISRTTLNLIERNTLVLPSGPVPAVLFKMTISKDVNVKFGDNDLIMTDALTVTSYILLAKSIGPVLEWGSRLRHHQHEPDADNPIPERFTEITLHRPL